MVALTMAAKEYDLVPDVFTLATVVIQIMNPFVEALPLRLGTLGIKLVVCGVFSVYQPKVVRGLRLQFQLLSKSNISKGIRMDGTGGWLCDVHSQIQKGLCWGRLEESSLQLTYIG